MSRYRPHVIKQGDYLAKLAYLYGFDAAEVWDHADNAALREKRLPSVLYPGDILYIPEARRPGLPVRKGAAHQFTAKVPTVRLDLVFKDGDEPLASEPCEVTGCKGGPLETELDAHGGLQLEVSVLARSVEVYFRRTHTRHVIQLGTMDPSDTSTGEAKRLQNLGYFDQQLLTDHPRAAVLALARTKFAKEHLQSDDMDAERLVELAGV